MSNFVNCCQVDEENRRVSERLKRAEKSVDQGNFKDTWKYIRFALERLYLVCCIKYGPPDFNPGSWKDMTAEYMWAGDSRVKAEDIFTKLAPDKTSRLKEILKMTVSGVHDKSPHSETDISNAIIGLRGLPNPLRIGAG